jgi:ATP-dependent DNA helicase RecQ
MVAGSKTLEEMATFLPQTVEQLEQISGFGKAKVDSYGADFLHLVNEYCAENNLTSNIEAKTPKRKRKETKEPKGAKVDTKAETLALYKEGKSVAEISAQRNLATQTIEGHLAHYVQNGQLRVEELVSREKIILIEPVVKEFASESLTTLKEKLGTDISFGEIRLVLASIEHQKSAAHINH